MRRLTLTPGLSQFRTDLSSIPASLDLPRLVGRDRGQRLDAQRGRAPREFLTQPNAFTPFYHAHQIDIRHDLAAIAPWIRGLCILPDVMEETVPERLQLCLQRVYHTVAPDEPLVSVQYLNFHQQRLALHGLARVLTYPSPTQLRSNLRSFKATALTSDVVNNLEFFLCLPTVRHVSLRFEDTHLPDRTQRTYIDHPAVLAAAISLFKRLSSTPACMSATTLWILWPSPCGRVLDEIPDLFSLVCASAPRLTELAWHNCQIPSDAEAGPALLRLETGLSIEYNSLMEPALRAVCPPPGILPALSSLRMSIDFCNFDQFVRTDVTHLREIALTWSDDASGWPTTEAVSCLLSVVATAVHLDSVEISLVDALTLSSIVPLEDQQTQWTRVLEHVIPLRHLRLRVFALTALVDVDIDGLREIAMAWPRLERLSLWTLGFMSPHGHGESLGADDVWDILRTISELRHLVIDLVFDRLPVGTGPPRSPRLSSLRIVTKPALEHEAIMAAFLLRDAPALRISDLRWDREERALVPEFTIGRGKGSFPYHTDTQGY